MHEQLDKLVDRILEGYRAVRRIGSGGMGTVFLVEHEVLGLPYAVKILSPSAEGELARLAERFVQEAKAAASITHPNVVGVHTAGSTDIDGRTYFYMVMDYVYGVTVNDILRQSPGRRLELPIAAFVALETLEGLREAHQIGLIHRDIKPDNIMVSVAGEVKVADFGLAKEMEGEGLTLAGELMGTPAYMAPEQWTGGTTDHRTDLYALGITMWQMIAGAPPYSGRSPMEVMANIMNNKRSSLAEVVPYIDRDLEFIILGLIAQKPIDRFQDALEAIDLLEAWLSGQDFDPESVIFALAERTKLEPFPDKKTRTRQESGAERFKTRVLSRRARISTGDSHSLEAIRAAAPEVQADAVFHEDEPPTAEFVPPEAPIALERDSQPASLERDNDSVRVGMESAPTRFNAEGVLRGEVLDHQNDFPSIGFASAPTRIDAEGDARTELFVGDQGFPSVDLSLIGKPGAEGVGITPTPPAKKQTLKHRRSWHLFALALLAISLVAGLYLVYFKPPPIDWDTPDISGDDMNGGLQTSAQSVPGRYQTRPIEDTRHSQTTVEVPSPDLLHYRTALSRSLPTLPDPPSIEHLRQANEPLTFWTQTESDIQVIYGRLDEINARLARWLEEVEDCRIELEALPNTSDEEVAQLLLECATFEGDIQEHLEASAGIRAEAQSALHLVQQRLLFHETRATIESLDSLSDWEAMVEAAARFEETYPETHEANELQALLDSVDRQAFRVAAETGPSGLSTYRAFPSRRQHLREAELMGTYWERDPEPPFIPPGLERIEVNDQGYIRYQRVSDWAMMVYVPAGYFLLRGEAESRQYPIEHDGFFLDELEVSNSMIQAFCEERGHEDWTGGMQGIGLARPAGNLTWEQAQEYSRWAGGDLPTEAQWIAAAYGPGGGSSFPWGNGDTSTIPAGICFSSSQSSPVNQCPGDRSFYGHHCLAGNVREWCRDIFDPLGLWALPSEQRSLIDPLVSSAEGDLRVVRGGSFATDASQAHRQSRGSCSSDASHPDLGFRVVIPATQD